MKPPNASNTTTRSSSPESKVGKMNGMEKPKETCRFRPMKGLLDLSTSSVQQAHFGKLTFPMYDCDAVHRNAALRLISFSLVYGKALFTILLIGFIFTSHAADFSQYFGLSGGTSGLGGRYSMFVGDYFTAKTGVNLNVRYSVKERCGKTLMETSAFAVPYLGVAAIPFRKGRVGGSIPLVYTRAVGTDFWDYLEDEIQTTPGLEFKAALSPGIEFYWYKDDAPWFAVEFGAVKINPFDADEVTVEFLCNLSIFLKRIGGD